MNKKGKYALNGAAMGGIGGLLLNLINQWDKMKKDPNAKFDWCELLDWAAKGALLGAGTGLLVGAIADELNKGVDPIDTDAWLREFAANNTPDINSPEYQVPNKKSEKIMSFLSRKFGDKLAADPSLAGSIPRKTAIRGSSDFDIVVRFHRNSFATLEDMYETVFEILSRFPDKFLTRPPRRQGKSIGMFFDSKLGEYKIDIVPQRDLNDDPNDTSGNLYVKAPSIFSSSTHTKTDIGAQQAQKLNPVQAKIVVILKTWKTDKEVPLKSYLLEQFVRKAYKANRGRIPSTLTAKLMMVVVYIHDNIETATIKSIENTNNILTDIPSSDKSAIRRAFKKVIEEYEYQPNSITKIFRMD